MSQFDLKKLRSATFEPRKETLIFTGVGFAEFVKIAETPPPALAKCEWTVRGLTGEEVARVKGEQDRRKAAWDTSLIAQNAGFSEIAGLFQKLAGEDDIPPEYVRNLYAVRIGTVEPEGLSHEDVKVIAKRFPIEFMRIAEKIWTLTGLGAVDKKKALNSGKTSE